MTKYILWIYLLKINRYEDRSSQLANAIQPASNKLFSNVIQNVYLYAPSTFIPNVSLNYFDEGTAANGDKLMKPYVGKGESYHNIGEKLKKMLNEIGWVPAIPVGDGDNLVSSSTDANKTVGYKENYTVSYLSTRTAPSDPKLSPAPFINNFGLIYPRYGLWILKKDGTFKNVKQTDDVTFSISPKDVPDSEEWARSADGYLRACVSFYNLNYVRLKYLYLDFLPEKPELEMKLPQTLTRSISDKLRLGYKANAAKKITLWHETEDGITLYDIDPNQSIFDIDLNDLDETIENNFTIHCSNDNGIKISKTVTYGGEAFLLKKYNIITSLKLTDQTNFIKAELVSTDGFGTNIDDANYHQNITQLQVLNINNSSTVYVNTNKSKTVLVPASNLNKGIYAVQAIDEQGKVYSAKFIK